MSINIIKQAVANYLSGLIVIFFIGISPAAYAQDLLEIFELALQNDPVLKQARASQLAIGESKTKALRIFYPMFRRRALAT